MEVRAMGSATRMSAVEAGMLMNFLDFGARYTNKETYREARAG